MIPTLLKGPGDKKKNMYEGEDFGPDAYPDAALRAQAQGRVVARLTVGADGRVSACEIVTSSGNSDLDSTTCRIARSRVRYTPAKDQDGRPIAQSGITLPVRWQLPQDCRPAAAPPRHI